jgi:predicted dehydrogenase
MVRIGIVGIGFMGMIHYLAAKRLEKTGAARVTAICSRDPKKRAGDWRGIRGNFGPPGEQMDLKGVKTFDRLEAMLADPDIDLIDICTPTAQHPAGAIAALKAGKHALVEKPIALRTEDADAMVATARAARKLLQVGHVLPFFPEFSFAHRAVKEGRYGRFLGGHFKRVITKPDWSAEIADAAQTGGPAIDLHIHDTHFIRMLCGMPREVSSVGFTENGVVQYLTTLYRFGPNGPGISCSSGAVACKDRQFVHGYELYFEKGTFSYESGIQPLIALKGDGGSETIDVGGGDALTAFGEELNAAITAIESGRESDVLGGALARDALVMCQRECESVISGKPVVVR